MKAEESEAAAAGDSAPAVDLLHDAVVRTVEDTCQKQLDGLIRYIMEMVKMIVPSLCQINEVKFFCLKGKRGSIRLSTVSFQNLRSRFHSKL